MEVRFSKRKIMKMKNSFVVTIPPEWIRSLGIKKGDVIDVTMSENGDLVLTARRENGDH